MQKREYPSLYITAQYIEFLREIEIEVLTPRANPDGDAIYDKITITQKKEIEDFNKKGMAKYLRKYNDEVYECLQNDRADLLERRQKYVNDASVVRAIEEEVDYVDSWIDELNCWYIKYRLDIPQVSLVVGITISPDYRICTIGDKEYLFSEGQGNVFEALFKNWKNGGTGVSEKYILKTV